MDFHTLSRKELQTLCKMNKIPANMTNVSMADALATLQQVEGLDELFNPMEPDARQFQEEYVVGTPDIHRTASRTATRKKAIREEPENSQVSTRLHSGTRAGNAEGNEQESKDANVPVTPAIPSSRRRAPAISTRRKKEAQMPEDENNRDQGKPTDVPRTPAAPSSRTRATGRSVCSKIKTPNGTAVQRAYSTRRSVRLLEKNLSRMSLMETEDIGLVKIGDISEDMSNVSQQTEDLAETENWPSLQPVSTVVSEKTDDLEVTSREKNTEYELGSAAKNDVGASLQAEPQEDLGEINYLKAEPHDSNLKLEGSSETYNDSNEVRESRDESDVDLNKSIGKAVRAGNEAAKSSEFDADHFAVNGLLFELEDSCDTSEPENKKCVGTKQDAPTEVSEDASMKVTDRDVTALSVEVTKQDALIEGSEDASMEVTDQDVAAFSVEVTKQDTPIEVSEDASMEVTGQDVAALSVEVTKQDVPTEVYEDAFMEVTDQDVAALSVEVPDEVTDQDIACLLPMSSVCNDLVSLKELVACNNQNGNDSAVISDALTSVLSCSTNIDVIPEEIAIPKQESCISAETKKHKSPSSVGNIDEVRLSTMPVAPIYEHKTSVQSVVADQLMGETHHGPAQSEPKDVANEIQTAPKMICNQEDNKNKINMTKENPSIDELEKRSMRELKQMLKSLTLNSKSKSKSNNVAKEVDRKRTALQALPENQMAAGEAQNDG